MEPQADSSARRHRRELRHPIEVWGYYRSPNGAKRDVVIKDLSETGCRFFDKFSVLAADRRISLKIEKLGPFDAVVRWAAQGYIGIEFETRLYGPVFDHIRERLSHANEAFRSATVPAAGRPRSDWAWAPAGRQPGNTRGVLI